MCSCAAAGHVVDLFDEDAARELSRHREVTSVSLMGTVFAAELRGGPGAALAAAGALREKHGVYARPLGGVIYLVLSPMTPPVDARRMQKAVAKVVMEGGGKAGGRPGGEVVV